jgi:superfamily II DNA helicase RecQ
MMALTATANKRTVLDIVSQLKLRRDHVSFTQSFNRTNLSYIVKLKRGTPFNDIVAFINDKHRGHAGIIYCQARKTCEQVAEKLRAKGLHAAHFHAGLSNEEKDGAFNGWQTGEISIIVATVSYIVQYPTETDHIRIRLRLEWVSTKQMVGFPLLFFPRLRAHCWFTVRFVIHYDMPKTLSG